MQESQGVKRFPKQAFMRQLDRLMATCGEFRDYYRERASLTQSPALQDLALSRSETVDEMWHELDGIMRTVAWWR